MVLFGGPKAFLDFSYDLRDKRDWKIAIIREAEHLSHPTAFAVDATNGLLAVGSKDGIILVFGSPAASLLLRIKRAIKFISFASLVFKLFALVCASNDMFVDLSTHTWLDGLSIYETSASSEDQTFCFSTSPYHSHIFIGLERGVVIIYDILCLKRSQYTIPNVWKAQDKASLHSGMPYSLEAISYEILDIVAHPRDLNLLFLLFPGGTERRALHRYEPIKIIPPGAPGALGYCDPDVMKPRRPSVTSLCIHASGQMFVTGHIDGTLAFWAVGDEDRPLMVRTVQKVDIDYPVGEELDQVISNPQPPSEDDIARHQLEPIFKLTWSSFGSQSLSDPYSSDTMLTILGGALRDQETGIMTIHLPPIPLPSPSSNDTDRVEPETRKILSKSFSSRDIYLYSQMGLLSTSFWFLKKILISKAISTRRQFLLSLNGQRDAVLLMQGNLLLRLLVLAYLLSRLPLLRPRAKRSLDLELSSTLKSVRLNDVPRDYTRSLPSALWTGLYGICDGDVVRLESEQHDLLRKAYHPSMSNRFTQMGREKVTGIAWVNYADHDHAQDVLFTKRQANRLLVTHHRDRSVRFQDISPQLLLASVSSPLSSSFPAPLPHLTIFLARLLTESCIIEARRPLTLDEAEVQSVQLTSESNECMVVMRSDHVFVLGFDQRQRQVSNFVGFQDDLIRLMHVPSEANIFQPTVMIENMWGPVTVAEMSDIGFLAVAYRNSALIIVDMRRPRIIFRDENDPKAQKRLSKALHLLDSDNEKQVTSMEWFVCGFGDDFTPRVRPMACQRSGNVRVFTLSQTSSGEWRVEDVQKLEGADNPLPRGTFILQAKTGTSRSALRATFREALQGGAAPSIVTRDPKDDGAHCFWVSVGEKGVKCHVNITRGRAGKVDWGRGKKIECVQVITRIGSHALVVAMDTREIFVYSLPALEPMHMFQLPKHPASVISIDDTGDFVDWIFDDRGESIAAMTSGTLFSIRRVFDEPVIDFTVGRRAAPTMPPPIPLAPIRYLGSWFNFKKGKSGDAIDDLLAGPNRPIPQDSDASSIVRGEWQAQIQSRAQEIAKQASQTSSNLYNNLSDAVSDRGDMLNGLQDQFSSLEAGGKKMMLEVRFDFQISQETAAQQTAKGWFNF
ncbi:SRO7_6 [Sanghuangporus weigelae]